MIYTGGQNQKITSIFESTVPNPIKFSFLKPVPLTNAAVEFQVLDRDRKFKWSLASRNLEKEKIEI